MKTILIILSTLCWVSSNAANYSKVNKSSSAFIENKGQITDQYRSVRNDIDFKLSADGIDVFVSAGKLYYQWCFTKENGSYQSNIHTLLNNRTAEQSFEKFYFNRVDVSLVGANINAEVVREKRRSDYDIFYTSTTGKDGATAYSYEKVTYKNIYPNIDWVLYTTNGSVKYDFVVNKGGNVKDIKLQYLGDLKLSLVNGELRLETEVGTITEERPYTFNTTNNEPIQSSFTLKNNNTIGFSVNAAPPFVIDPSVAWGTYYGGTGDDGALSVVVDKQDNVYLHGNTRSGTNIATTGAFQTSAAFDNDLYIAKFTQNCQRIWGTYIATTGLELDGKIKCDKNGNIYLAATSNGTSVLTTIGAHQPSLAGGLDAILLKFSPSGSRIWGTYYGSSTSDYGISVEVDTNNFIYLIGQAGSSSNIGTPGTHMPTSLANQPFVAKFDSSGVRQWGTYFGGSTGTSDCEGSGIDKNNDIYICGSTATTTGTGIGTSGAYQTAYSGAIDGFVAKFNKTTGTILWSTYFGGNGGETVTSISIDTGTSLYLCGTTTSTDTISSPSAFNTSCDINAPSSGSYSAFLAKLNSNTGSKIWGTYYGGDTSEDKANAVMTDSFGNVYMAGYTNSRSGIATPNAMRPTPYVPWQIDGFLTKFNTNGARLWGTYIGDSSNEVLTSIYYHKGYVFVAGYKGGGGVSYSVNSHQPNWRALYDSYLLKLYPDTVINIVTPVDTTLCPNFPLNVNFVIGDSFKSGNIFTAQLSDNTGSFASPITIGTFTSTVAGTIPCHIPTPIPAGTQYKLRIVSSMPYKVSESVINNISIQPMIPSVAITSNAPGPVTSGSTIIFTISSQTNQGTSPTYQWILNGIPIAGATNNTYFNNTFVDKDAISLIIKSSDSCAFPDTVTSNVIIVSIVDISNGVKNIVKGNDFVIFPNPNNGYFRVNGSCIDNSDIEYTIVNIVGTTIKKGILKPNNNRVSEDIAIPDLSSGNYIFKIHGLGTNVHLRVIKD